MHMGPELSRQERVGVFDGTSCGRVIQAYRAADIALEGCWSYMPWKCHCLEDALSMAHEAMVHGRHASFEGLGMHDGVKHRCLDGHQTPNFTDCSRDSQEEATLERWTSVGCASVGASGQEGSFHNGAHVHGLSLFAHGGFCVVLGEKQQLQVHCA